MESKKAWDTLGFIIIGATVVFLSSGMLFEALLLGCLLVLIEVLSRVCN